MKLIASHPQPPYHKPSAPSPEAGFTLTELLAGLLVASMLIVGISQLTWRYAASSNRIRSEAGSIQDGRMISTLFADVDLADPDSLKVNASELSATVHGKPLTGRIKRISADKLVLEWSSPRLERTVDAPIGSAFEATPEGLVVLRSHPDQPPLAVAIPKRSIPADCQFDTVIRECRQ